MTAPTQDRWPPVFGLLITRDDEAVFDDWCREQLPFYAAVVCLDGSTTDATTDIARKYGERLIYLHERKFPIPHKTDHGLRRVVHQEIVRRFGTGHWIMCCHVDEFCYHDPRKIACLAERQGFDLVSWYSPHFYPHPIDLNDWGERKLLPVYERHRFYHWGHAGTGQPWIEDRLYRDAAGVSWDESTHGSVRPHGVRRPAPFHPIFQHYKVVASDTDWCDAEGDSTYYRHHWVGLEHRTGLPYAVRRFEDLFVESVRNYAVCDRFDGRFEQPWNMGDEFRPDSDLQREAKAVLGESDGLRADPMRTAAAVEDGNRPLEKMVSPPPTAASVQRVFRMPIRDKELEVAMYVRGAVDEAIIRDLWQRDVYGLQRLHLLQPRMIVDIGAHIGAFSLLANEYWPTARIIACEADPDNVESLRHHVSGRAKIEVVAAAIVDHDEPEVTFHAVQDKAAHNSGGGSCVRLEPASVPIRVPAISLVQLWRDKGIAGCDLLKLDCEGGEPMLLSALANAGLLGQVRNIVGEWHATDAHEETVATVRHQLRSILALTHVVDCMSRPAGREGHFIATLDES